MKFALIWWFFLQKFVTWHQETEFIFGWFLAFWDHCATKGCCTGKLWRRSSGSWQSSLYRFKQRRRQHQDQVVQRLRPREVQGGEGGLGREGRKARESVSKEEKERRAGESAEENAIWDDEKRRADSNDFTELRLDLSTEITTSIGPNFAANPHALCS